MNQKPVEELTQIAHVSKARDVAKQMVNKLKEHVPRQLFEIAIQAKVSGKVIARENIKALRKDVLAKCVSIYKCERMNNYKQTWNLTTCYPCSG